MCQGGSGARSIGEVPAEGTGQLRMRPPRYQVSPKAIWYWTVRAACGWLIVIVAEALWMLLVNDGAGGWHLLGLAATVVASAAHLPLMPPGALRRPPRGATPP